MPAFMNFPIANDATSVTERASSTNGYLDSDVDLLVSLKILIKNRSGISLNKKLVNEPSEIRDFLTWAAGAKKTPLPPLARRILCLKRAIIKNSIASVNPGNQQRTGEKQQLEEIDMLLKADGAVNLDDDTKCMTEGNKWLPKSSGAGKLVSTTNSKNGLPPGCHTTVNCAPDSALSALIGEIKAKLDTLDAKGCDLTALTAKVDAIDAKLERLGQMAPSAGPSTNVGPSAPSTNLEGLVADAADIESESERLADANNRTTNSTGSNLSVISGKIDRMITKTATIPIIRPDVRVMLVRHLNVAQERLGEGPEKRAVEKLIGDINSKTETSPASVSAQPSADHAAIEAALREIKDETAQIQPIQELIRQIQERMGAGDDVGESVETLKAILQSYGFEEKFTALQNAVDPLHGELEEIRSVLNNAMERLQDMPGQLTALSAQVVSNLLPRLTTIENALTAKLDEIKADTTAIRGDLDTIRSGSEQRNTAAAAQLDAQDSKLERIEDKLDSLTQHISLQGRETLAALASTTGQIATLKNLIEAINCPSVDTAPIMEALERYKTDIQQQIAALRTSDNAGRNATHITRIQGLEETIHTLEERIRECNGNEARIAELESEITRLRGELDALQTSSNSARGNVRDLTEAAAQRNRDIADKNRRIAELEEEKSRITVAGEQELHEARLLSEKLEAEAGHLQTLIDSLKTRLRGISNNSNAKTDRISAMETEKEELERRLRECEAARAALEANIAALEAAHGANSAELEDLRRQLAESVQANKKAINNATNVYKRRLEAKWKEAADAIIAAQNRLNAAPESAKDALQTELDAARARIAELETALDTANQERNDARANALGSNAEKEKACKEKEAALQTDLDAARARIAELETALDTANQERNDARANALGSDAEKEKECKEKETELQTDLDAAQARIAKLEADIQAEINSFQRASNAADAEQKAKEDAALAEAEAARAAAERAAENAKAARATAEAVAARNTAEVPPATPLMPPAPPRSFGSSVNEQIKAIRPDVRLPYLQDKFEKLQKKYPRIKDAAGTALAMTPLLEAYGNPSLLNVKLEQFFRTDGGRVIRNLIPEDISNPVKTLQNIFTLFNKTAGGTRKRRRHLNKSAHLTRRRR